MKMLQTTVMQCLAGLILVRSKKTSVIGDPILSQK